MESVSFTVTSSSNNGGLLESGIEDVCLLPHFDPLSRVLSNQLALCLVKPETKDTEPDLTWDTLPSIAETKPIDASTSVATVEVVLGDRRRYQCDQCDRCYVHKCDLVKHRLVHTGDLTCKICGKCCSRNSDLKIHLATHEDVKPFACTSCPKTFSQPASLRKHLRTHSGDGLSTCQCGKQFVNVADLKKHARVHTREQPFACKICERKFSQSANLKAHMRTHMQEKSFECDICGKGFALKNLLTKHKKTHR